jgi:hypothetical protein
MLCHWPITSKNSSMVSHSETDIKDNMVRQK